MRLAMLAAAALSLAACATASKPGAMVAELTDSTIISDQSALRNSFTVGEVSGGKKTNPLWVSKVSSEDFAEALRQSLASHAMLASAGGKYVVDAELVEVKQPLAGFNLTVKSTVKYKVAEAATSAIVLEEAVTHEHTAKMGEAFVAAQRLRLANEGSMKGNIAQFIETLVKTMDAAPASMMLDDVAPDSTPQS